jgi:hypothetical protein
VKKLYDIDVAKVNTLIRSDGEKKAYVWLLIMMLWILPTKLEYLNWVQLANSKYTFFSL